MFEAGKGVGERGGFPVQIAFPTFSFSISVVRAFTQDYKTTEMISFNDRMSVQHSLVLLSQVASLSAQDE